MNGTQKIFIISDAHLGAETKEKEKVKLDKLLSFFEFVQQQDGQLVILGDLFDFWFEYRTVVMKQHFHVLAALDQLVKSGVSIDYIAGNHDFWVGSFLRDDIGLNVVNENYTINLNTCKMYFQHGDGLLKSDWLYRVLKRILRNRVNIFLYRLLHPDFGIPFALFWSRSSRNAAKNMAFAYCDIDYREFADHKLLDCDMVVLGHTHWPACERRKNGWYLNPGSWMVSSTYLAVSSSRPELMQWDGRRANPYLPDLPPGN